MRPFSSFEEGLPRQRNLCLVGYPVARNGWRGGQTAWPQLEIRTHIRLSRVLKPLATTPQAPTLPHVTGTGSYQANATHPVVPSRIVLLPSNRSALRPVFHFWLSNHDLMLSSH